MPCRGETWLIFSKSLEASSISCTWCFLWLASIPIHNRPHIRRSWRRQYRASTHHWLRNGNSVHRENVDWLNHNQIVSCKTILDGWTSLFSRRQRHNLSDTQSIPVSVSRKYVVPAAHEALIRIFSTARPKKDTLALIEPRIASIHTLDDMPQDEIWQSVIIARTMTQWSSLTNSALVQVGNPSDLAIIL